MSSKPSGPRSEGNRSVEESYASNDELSLKDDGALSVASRTPR